jgi:hypothetical protein
MTRPLILSLALLAAAAAAPARAAIAVLRSGGMLKISSWSQSPEGVRLQLLDGGEIEISASFLVALVPDEVPSEARRATPPFVVLPSAPGAAPLLLEARRQTAIPATEATRGVDAVLTRARATR